MKRPAFQFYPADWRKDVELRSCSLAARGLWIDLLCIAHECEPYGHLTVNGKAMNAAQIAGQVGLTKQQCVLLLQELTDNGVARATPEGIIFSKRMVDDERLRNIRAEAGKLGGNPALVGKKDKQTPTTKVNQSPTPSSSSSSSNLSEANASAAGAAAELTKAELWEAGKSLLLEAGVPKGQCGSFVGKLVADYGDAIVVDAVRAAVVATPADPKEYLKATCMRLKGERGADHGKPLTVPSNDDKVTQAWIAQHTAPVEQTPEQRAATAERLRLARETLTRQAA